MRESDKLYDEEALNFEFADVALELAGSRGWDRHLPFLDPTLIVMKEEPANNRLPFHFAASDRRPRDKARRLAAKHSKLPGLL